MLFLAPIGNISQSKKNMSITITTSTPIIKDFLTFLNYCEQEKPKLTKSKEYINRKSLHSLNQLLEIPAKDVNPRIDQQYYLPIHFYYNLALESEIFQIDRAKKNAFYLTPQEEKINTFRTLSATAQYLFLLKTYWVYCDWEAMSDNSSGRISVGMGDQLLKEMAEAQVGKIYTRKKQDKIVERANWLLNEHIIFWELLGWLKPVRSTQFDTKSFFAYDTITLTELGKIMAQLLVEERLLTEWNEAYLIHGPSMFDAPLMQLIGEEEEKGGFDMEFLELPENPSEEQVLQQIGLMEKQSKEVLGIDLNLMELMDKFMKKGQSPSIDDIMDHLASQMENQAKNLPEPEVFETVFQPIFPNETISNLNIKTPISFKDGQYIFKVSMQDSAKTWRKVALNGGHTLLDLHIIIQEAFDFDDDHLYVFYLDRQQRQGFYDPRSGDAPSVQDAKVGGLNLSENQRFYYIFDFGDYWEFNIDLLEIKKDAKKLRNPKIIEKKGKAPDQYPDYNEEEW